MTTADDPAMSEAIVTAARQGDELLLLDKQRGGRGLPGRRRANRDWRKLVAQATRQNDPTTELTSDRAIAVQTVWDDGTSAAPRSARWCSSAPPARSTRTS